MLEKKKLWILSELFYPETTSTAYIMTDLAKKLSEKYEVHVLCGNPTYDTTDNIVPLDNITVHRINDKKIDKNNRIKRLVRALTLSNKMVSFLSKEKDNVDKILFVTNPALLPLKVSKWTHENNKESYLLVHDVFPENAINTNILKSKILGCLLKKAFDKAYSKITKIIVIGRDMKDVVSKKICSERNIEVITNWAEPNNIIPKENNNEGKIVIQFAGNIGRVQGLMDFLVLLKNVHNNNIEIKITGNGALKKDIEQFVSDNKIENVVFASSYKRSEENAVLAACDIALITLQDTMYGLVVPSKLYNNLAAGKPILYIGPKCSEVYLTVEENKIGYAFSFSQKDDIIEFLNNLGSGSRDILQKMGVRSRELAETKYSKEICLNKFAELI